MADQSKIDPSILIESKAEVADLLSSANGHLQEIVMTVDSEMPVSEEVINALFRGVHSLKGIARILENKVIESAIHLVEDLLGLLRSNPSLLTKDVLEPLTIGVDLVSDLMEALINEEDILTFKSRIADAQGTISGCISRINTGKVEAIPNPSSDMSDDEAAALLAAMESPIHGEQSGDSGALGELNDDEAAALLAEMEAPISREEPQEDSASDMSDDEAAALLAAMEGSEVETDKSGATDITSAVNLGEEDDEEDEEGEGVIDDETILGEFLESVHDIFANLDNSLIELEGDPTNEGLIADIFRNAHTLKGTAGMFGFTKIVKLTHKMENIFDKVRKGEILISSHITDLFLICLDKLRAIVDCIEAGEPVNVKTKAELKKLDLVLQNKTPDIASLKSGAAENSQKASAAAAKVEDNQKPAAGVAGSAKESEKTEAKPPRKKESAGKKAASTIRVDIERLDVLVNLIGELLVDRSRFQKIEEELRGENVQSPLRSFMTESIQMYSRHMADIQDLTLKMRMVPIGNAFNKFPRVVRDAARGLNKEIDLIIEGDDVELDKTIVEEVADPLVHLIRNSVDHGIEMPEIRQQKGKERKGTIWLKAFQEGNNIVIEIKDNGKGIPVDIIRNKGIEKGLIKETDVCSDKEIMNLIFSPGFSTAEQVTNLSGRGVGMDVVKRNISKLKGLIDIDSQEGQGTTMQIKVPLTIGILQSLVVNVAGEIFAVPLGNVIESLRISMDEIQVVDDYEVMTLRNQVLPLIRLEEVFKLSSREERCWYAPTKKFDGTRKHGKIFVVVVGLAEKRIGLVVDNLITQQEVVIKSLGKLLTGVKGFSGGVVLGDGTVSLILDIPEIVENLCV